MEISFSYFVFLFLFLLTCFLLLSRLLISKVKFILVLSVYLININKARFLLSVTVRLLPFKNRMPLCPPSILFFKLSLPTLFCSGA